MPTIFIFLAAFSSLSARVLQFKHNTERTDKSILPQPYPQPEQIWRVGSHLSINRKSLLICYRPHGSTTSPNSSTRSRPEYYSFLIIGIYHSHPDHCATPSKCDRLYAWAEYSYIIVAIHHGQAGSIGSWTLDEQQQFQPESITIIPS